jgi:hypothetical protein
MLFLFMLLTILKMKKKILSILAIGMFLCAISISTASAQLYFFNGQVCADDGGSVCVLDDDVIVITPEE